MRRKIEYLLWCGISALLLVACSSKKGLHRENVAFLYQRDGLILHPEFRVFHYRPDSTRLYFHLKKSDLLYTKSEGKEYRAKMKISYRLIPSYEDLNILDSASITIRDKALRPHPGGEISGYFDFKTPVKPDGQEDYKLLIVRLTDLSRSYEHDEYIRIYTENDNHSQFFLARDSAGQLIFNPVRRKGDRIQVAHRSNSAQRLEVRYYRRQWPLASPPYVNESNQRLDFSADSVFSLNAEDTITLAQQGIYHFRKGDESKLGFTVFVFDESFPLVVRKEQLGPPLRYLTSKKEYAEIEREDPDSMKLAVDRFWLRNAGSPERGKVLVKEYYQRVQEANVLFTSYHEGWKTDRGMVYVIFGPPTTVYRSTSGESWVYGDENSSLSYRFNFIKLGNPFTENDYALNRLNSYRYVWGQAIESWRNGHVYNIKDIKREQNESDQQARMRRPPYFWY